MEFSPVKFTADAKCATGVDAGSLLAMQENSFKVWRSGISRLTQTARNPILFTCFACPTPTRHAVACARDCVGREPAGFLPTHPMKRVGFVFHPNIFAFSVEYGNSAAAISETANY